MAGLGIGLLSAAATSISPTLTDLAGAGAYVVRAAFRLGIHVYQISEQLEATDTDGNPWAFVVPGLTADVVQTELDRYNDQTVRGPASFIHSILAAAPLTHHLQTSPSLARIFISASDKTSITVSGPPSRLRSCLKSSDVLRYSNFLPLPVHHGLCHAPHLYSAEDVQTIMADVFKEDHDHLSEAKMYCTLLSSGTGRPYHARDFSDLLSQLVTELLMKKMHIDNIADGIVSNPEIPSDEQQQRTLWTFRTSMLLKAIMKNVEKQSEGRLTFTPRDLVEWTKREEGEYRVPRSPKQSKLAVVGMSCRLPGGANDLELFWKLMMDRRDVHTRIPPDRFDLETHFDPTGQKENATQTPYMNYMENPGFFDAGFFNISPKEVVLASPIWRFLIVTRC